MNLILADLNQNVVEAGIDMGIESRFGDYFRIASSIKRSVMMTASNPHFSMGGGIDYLFEQNFPYWTQIKKIRGGGNERIGSICFCITVDNRMKASKELVKEAIQFAISETGPNETLVISGAGTGIGGMSIADFREILKEVVPKKV